MNDLSYVIIKGKKTGSLLSSGCSSQASIGHLYPSTHQDKIMALSVSHTPFSGNRVGSSGDNEQHLPVVFTKYLDISTPLLAIALNEGEELVCTIEFYYSADASGQDHYYAMCLEGARIVQISLQMAPSSRSSLALPIEAVSIRYRHISWLHHAGGPYPKDARQTGR